MMREFELILDPVTVPPLLVANISVNTPVDFCPESLLIDHDVAGDFLVTDIKCRYDSQLISRGGLPGLLFSDAALIERFSFDALKAGDRMMISVINHAKEDRVFAGCVKGERGKGIQKGRRRYALGCSSTRVVGKSAANINVMPQLAFKPDRLVIPSLIRENFEIQNIFFTNGGVRESLDAGLLSQPFMEHTTGRLEFSRSVCPATFLSVAVRNISDSDLNFQAAILGFSVLEEIVPSR